MFTKDGSEKAKPRGTLGGARLELRVEPTPPDEDCEDNEENAADDEVADD